MLRNKSNHKLPTESRVEITNMADDKAPRRRRVETDEVDRQRYIKVASSRDAMMLSEYSRNAVV